jgi:hypothetical protein
MGPNRDRHYRDGGHWWLGTRHTEGIGGKSPTFGTTTGIGGKAPTFGTTTGIGGKVTFGMTMGLTASIGGSAVVFGTTWIGGTSLIAKTIGMASISGRVATGKIGGFDMTGMPETAIGAMGGGA